MSQTVSPPLPVSDPELLERLVRVEEMLNNLENFNKDLDTSIPNLPSPIRLAPIVVTSTPQAVHNIPTNSQHIPRTPNSNTLSKETTNNIFTPTLPVTPSQLPATQLEMTTDTSAAFFLQMCGNSCSRENYAANLCREWFSIKERKTRNVRGKNGKEKLNQQKMKTIYSATFQMYPLTSGGKENKAWSDCIKSIYEANRRLNRTPNEEN